MPPKLPSGFGSAAARREAVAAIPIGRELGEVAKEVPVLENPIRELITAAVTNDKRVMFAGTNPRITSDPVIGSIAEALDAARLDNIYKLDQWEQHLQRVVLPVVGHAGSDIDKGLMNVLKGVRAPADEGERVVSTMRNAWLRDLGVQSGDPALQRWSQSATDLEALYRAHAEAFASPTSEGAITGTTGYFKTFDQLSEKFRDTLSRPEYSNLLDVFAKKSTFNELNATEKDVFSSLLNRYRYEPAIPTELQSSVPDFFGQRYLLHGGTLPESAFQQIRSELTHFQHRGSVEKMANTLQPLIDMLPEKGGELGSMLMPSRKQFAQKMLSQFVYNTRTVDEQELSRVVDASNRALMNPILSVLGSDLKDPLTVNGIRNMVNAVVRGEYRGFLSIDTAMLDMGLGFNIWAETGRFLGPFFRSIAKVDAQGAARGVPSSLIHDRMGYLLESESAATGLEKLRQMDVDFTKFVMSPLTFMHNIMRGSAFLAGTERAIAQGVDGTTALRVGLRSGSRFVEDLTLTKAQMEAFNTMARATFGFSKLETAPNLQGPLGRLTFMFMNWPNNQAQMIVHGFGRAFSEGDTTGLLRYTALLGLHLGVANWALWSGLDLNKFFLSSNFSYFSWPFWRQLTDAVYATTGQAKEIIGFTPDVKELRAKDRVKELMKGIAYPQYRAVKEVAESYKAVQKGYRLDQEAKLLYYTTPWGEMMRIFGIRPAELRATREVVQEMQNRTAIFHAERRTAVADLVAHGDPAKALEFEQKYGSPITMEYIQNFMKESGQLPDERAMSRMPMPLRPGARDLLDNVP